MKRYASSCLTVTLVSAILCGCATVPAGPEGRYKGRDNDPASQSRLQWHVRVLAETLAPRDVDHPSNLERTARYIRSQFARTGAAVYEEPYSADGEKYRNVCARFGAESGPRIVVGAHYDSYADSPGADDNASGVAALIEIAHLLDRMEPNLERTIELVAFATEEPPYFGTADMGSYVHAESCKRAEIPVELFIALDQIGYFDDAPASQRFPNQELADRAGTTAGDFIAILGLDGYRELVATFAGIMQQATNLPVKWNTFDISYAPGFEISDARIFADFGYPAILITDTAPFRGSIRHTAGDTADTLDYSRMRAAVISLASALTHWNHSDAQISP